MMRLCRCLSQHNAALKLLSQYQSPMVPSGAVGDFFLLVAAKHSSGPSQKQPTCHRGEHDAKNEQHSITQHQANGELNQCFTGGINAKRYDRERVHG